MWPTAPRAVREDAKLLSNIYSTSQWLMALLLVIIMVNFQQLPASYFSGDWRTV